MWALGLRVKVGFGCPNLDNQFSLAGSWVLGLWVVGLYLQDVSRVV